MVRSLFLVGVLVLGGCWRAGAVMPVSYWDFDGQQGILLKDLAGSNDGTIHGAVRTTGLSGEALLFDGQDDYVSLSSNAVTTTEFSISAWANHLGPGGGAEGVNAVFSQRADPAGDDNATITMVTDSYRYPNHAVVALRSSSGAAQVLTHPKKGYNQWHHYVMTVSATDFAFYVDGVEVGRTANSQAGDYVTAVDYVTIGRERYKGIDKKFFNGLIDEVKVFDTSLSGEEVEELYEEVVPEPASGVLFLMLGGYCFVRGRRVR